MIASFKDDYAEELIRRTYYQIIGDYPDHYNQIIDYEDLNQIAQDILNNDVVESLYTEEFSYLIETSFLGILTTANLGLTFLDSQPISEDWLEVEEDFDPNSWLGHILLTIAQNGLGIIQLNMLGVDAPSRVILRSLVEYIWIYSIISMDKKYFLSYKQLLKNEDSNLWWKKFRAGKLKSKLTSLEEGLGLPKSNREYFQNFRESVYGHYSDATHMSPLAGLASPYKKKFNEDALELRILAGATENSKPILEDLNKSLHYIHLMIWAILGHYHNFKIEDHLQDWGTYYSLNWYYTTLIDHIEET